MKYVKLLSFFTASALFFSSVALGATVNFTVQNLTDHQLIPYMTMPPSAGSCTFHSPTSFSCDTDAKGSLSALIRIHQNMDPSVGPILSIHVPASGENFTFDDHSTDVTSTLSKSIWDGKKDTSVTITFCNLTC